MDKQQIMSNYAQSLTTLRPSDTNGGSLTATGLLNNCTIEWPSSEWPSSNWTYYRYYGCNCNDSAPKFRRAFQIVKHLADKGKLDFTTVDEFAKLVEEVAAIG